MAQKRMFSMKIVDSDAFLEMPLSTQCLYFHLNMRADDDGFVGNPRKIMRLINSGEDDLKVLIAKRFVLPFDNSVMVIKHWLIHNTIQSDRYKPTVYADEKQQLFIKDNKAYTLTPQEHVPLPEKTDENDTKNAEETDVSILETFCSQSGNTDIDLDIGKDLDIEKDCIYDSCIKDDCVEVSDNTRARDSSELSNRQLSKAIASINEHLRRNCHLNFYLDQLNKYVKTTPELQVKLDAMNKVIEILYCPTSQSDVKAVLQLTEKKFLKLIDKFISPLTQIENEYAYVWTSVYNALKENNDD